MNAIEKAVEFQKNLRRLMEDSMRAETPLATMIECLGAAGFELRTIQLSLRRQQAVMESASKIIPAGQVKLPGGRNGHPA